MPESTMAIGRGTDYPVETSGTQYHGLSKPLCDETPSLTLPTEIVVKIRPADRLAIQRYRIILGKC
jgi:hypothetical protein